MEPLFTGTEFCKRKPHGWMVFQEFSNVPSHRESRSRTLSLLICLALDGIIHTSELNTPMYVQTFLAGLQS
jgi:hypothetical protein